MSLNRKFDGAEPVRINKWLAQSGVCSRREAEALIAKGVVLIDGEPVSDPGRKIEPGQTLTLKEAGTKALDDQATYVINKPIGYVSSQPEGDQIPAARLLVPANLDGPRTRPPARDARLAPLGRLDQDSRGLLLLSEDGVLAKSIIGPDTELEKEYVVDVSGRITDAAIEQLRHGLELDGRKLRPATVIRNGHKGLRFILTEGRKRQIRRMCELVGLEVTDLIRLRIGPLKLGPLSEGKWRRLTPQERAALIKAAKPRK